MKKIKSRFCDYAGYGKNDPRPGCHVCPRKISDTAPTITSHVELNMVILEEWI